MTLADLTPAMPVDGPTGAPLVSHDGRPDRPEDYEVIRYRKDDGGFRALVIGPSGDTDLVVDDVSGCRIYRDCSDLNP